MRKLSLSFLAVLLLAGVVAPTAARADTDISFVFSNGGGPRPVYADWDHHGRGRHYRGWHQRWHHRPTVFSPVMVAPLPRTVVYERTVVRPATYVEDSYLLAQPASPSYMDADGRTCREYTSSAQVAGSRGMVYGTACLQPDGSWRVVN